MPRVWLGTLYIEKLLFTFRKTYTIVHLVLTVCYDMLSQSPRATQVRC